MFTIILMNFLAPVLKLVKQNENLSQSLQVFKSILKVFSNSFIFFEVLN